MNESTTSYAAYTSLFQRQGFHHPKNLQVYYVRTAEGLTMIPWHAGRHLMWDATVVDTLAPSSYVLVTAAMAGSGAEIATDRGIQYVHCVMHKNMQKLTKSEGET